MIAALRASLADRYEFGPQLGMGGMATVYRAHDLKHDRDVAIKVLHPEHSALVAASRFLQEIHLVAQLNHPSIVPLHDSGEAAGLLYYVMPCIEGESLRQRLERERQLPVEDALRITHEIADGLWYAHEMGVIHRDIKPENILLSHHHAQLADFGIARAMADAGSGTFTRTGLFVGTPLYTSPEQASGMHAIDARADQYSLACVLYEMLAGEPPFTGPTQQAVLAKHALETRPSVRTVRDTVPRHVDAALQRAMARVPADRFGTVEEFTHALAAAPRDDQAADGASPRSRKLLVTMLVAAVGLAAAFVLVPGSRLRDVLGKPAAAVYAGVPAWSDWVDVSGEHFLVFAATDSALVVHSAGADSLYSYDGNRWAGFQIPDGFAVRPLLGSLTRSRLLATRPDPDGAAQGHAFWWLELAPEGLRAVQRLPDLGTGQLFPRWWTDGTETVLWWARGIDRLDGERWVRESTGTAGRIRALWGRDFRHRYAITSSAEDSLLVHDGISWHMLDIMPDRSTHVPRYASGSLLRDGTSVVLGEACDSAGCLSLVLQQDTFGGTWRRVDIPEGSGLPGHQRPATADCGPARFTLAGAGGASRQDYYVWGDWVRCERLPMKRRFADCPSEWPCVWHVSQGRLEPVPELRGHVLDGVLATASTTFALAEDGTLWRRVDERWRPVDQVPELVDRKVAASSAVIVASQGRRVLYEPGAGDTVSGFFVATLPLPELSPSGAIRAIAVHDSAVALLASDGTVFHSACAITPEAAGAARSLACAAPIRLGGAGSAAAIGLLGSGNVLAVGRGAVRFHNGEVVREMLPRVATSDTLWAVSVATDGTATVVGNRTLLQRDASGTWTVLRAFAEAGAKGDHFAVLPGGDVVIAGGWLRLWERTAETPPLAVLQRPVEGEKVTALHALADGRLVAGFASDAPGVGGWIQVWGAPVRAGRFERMELPLNVDVTSLADDGVRLIVAGRGGSMAIPLRSIPFAAASPD